jgi:hypothetical protein
MDLVTASSVIGALRESAQVFLSSVPESISLTLWGCALLLISGSVRSLVAPAHRVPVTQSRARAQYGSKGQTLSESRA